MNNAARRNVAIRLLTEVKGRKQIDMGHLKSALSAEAWSRLQTDIDQLRQYKHNQPPEVTKPVQQFFGRYTEMLCQADRLQTQAERMNPTATLSQGKKLSFRLNGKSHWCRLSSRGAMSLNAESCYEQALEILDELLDEYPEMAAYLDRQPFQDGACIGISPDCASVPRLNNSKSQHNRTQRPKAQSIRQLIIEALETEILALSFLVGY